MISIEAVMRGMPLLYLFAKPPGAILPELKRLRALFGIESGYALDRVHSTFLALGEATPARIGKARDIVDRFHGEPFDVAFDHIEGVALKPQKGQRAPGIFQRALTRHFAVSGFSLPAYDFGLHLNLDYGNPSDRRAAIPLLRWTVEEILLIESGRGHHIVHGRLPLLIRQYALAL